MHIPLEPLTDAEEATLARLLEQTGSVTLAHARGVFSAVCCEPSVEDPVDWAPLVLGANVPDTPVLREIFALLLRDRYVLAECLALGEPILPAPEDAEGLIQFCKGFVRLVRISKLWQQDVEGIALTLPLAVHAGYLSQESLDNLRTTSIPDAPAVDLSAPDLVQPLLAVYAHFADARRKHAEAARASAESASQKVGRNEPCPCGSGKKLKKCCGA